jgi:hypothetical protein|tara:strand:+ start:342 stop:542 length:201 start_codon:yes stop_codon:yes gene_type:complete
MIMILFVACAERVQHPMNTDVSLKILRKTVAVTLKLTNQINVPFTLRTQQIDIVILPPINYPAWVK